MTNTPHFDEEEGEIGILKSLFMVALILTLTALEAVGSAWRKMTGKGGAA